MCKMLEVGEVLKMTAFDSCKQALTHAACNHLTTTQPTGAPQAWLLLYVQINCSFRDTLPWHVTL